MIYTCRSLLVLPSLIRYSSFCSYFIPPNVRCWYNTSRLSDARNARGFWKQERVFFAMILQWADSTGFKEYQRYIYLIQAAPPPSWILITVRYHVMLPANETEK